MATDTDSLLAAFGDPPAALAADLQAVREPWVRDLAWLLHAPNMMLFKGVRRPSLDTLGLADRDRRIAWLGAQETLTGQFRQRLDQRRSQRLGIYHETLWQWIFAYAPRTRLVAHNVVLREGNQTRGELDLLYATRETYSLAAPYPPRLCHAELAIKFYLGLGAGPGDDGSAARWIGVGSFDSLALKASRLTDRQLPMGLSPPAGKWREQTMPGAQLRQSVIMPGILFHPWNRRLILPDTTPRHALQGLWCQAGEWPRLAAQLPERTQAQRLLKPHWLAPQSGTTLTLAEVGRLLESHFEHHGSPLHLRLTLTNRQQCRLFVVKDGWPSMVPLPPPSAR